MFIDSATILCEAGKGGDGCNSFKRSRLTRHPSPDGGDGGRGGSIVLAASPNVHTLLDVQMQKTFRAADGKHASSNHKAGADAADREVLVPAGTEVYDDATGLLLKDLAAADGRVLVARGGAGGKGNHRRAEATRGEPGERRFVRLELKLIADVGLVGFPNAGKSTFLNRVSNAHSKVAAYPFTTKEPVLGVARIHDDAVVMADIPGLIKGAHEGKGLGDRFLRHIERTRLFLHLIDMAGVDGRDPVEDYHVINAELAGYAEAFRLKPRIVAANKMDIPEAAANLVKFKAALPGVEVFGISAATGQGLVALLSHLHRILRQGNETAHETTVF